MKVVLFRDGSYGLRKYDWKRLSHVYLDFNSLVWIASKVGVPNGCKRTWEEAETRRLDLEDKGESV